MTGGVGWLPPGRKCSPPVTASGGKKVWPSHTAGSHEWQKGLLSVVPIADGDLLEADPTWASQEILPASKLLHPFRFPEAWGPQALKDTSQPH